MYCNTDLPEEIAENLIKIVEDKNLREKLVFDGIVWAGEFNWENTVKNTLKLITN